MIRTRYPPQPLRLGSTLKYAFHHLTRSILIVIAADEKFRCSAIRQKPIRVVSTLCSHRNSKPDRAFPPRIPAAGAHPNVRAKRKSCEENRPSKILLQP